jgi:hypothetical protein
MSATAIWQTIGGIIGILGVIGVLARISYQLGSLVTEFRGYVKLNDLVVGKLDSRVQEIEHKQRTTPDRRRW